MLKWAAGPSSEWQTNTNMWDAWLALLAPKCQKSKDESLPWLPLAHRLFASSHSEQKMKVGPACSLLKSRFSGMSAPLNPVNKAELLALSTSAMKVWRCTAGQIPGRGKKTLTDRQMREAASTISGLHAPVETD